MKMLLHGMNTVVHCYFSSKTVHEPLVIFAISTNREFGQVQLCIYIYIYTLLDGCQSQPPIL